jgi:hypothetical protein
LRRFSLATLNEEDPVPEPEGYSSIRSSSVDLDPMDLGDLGMCDGDSVLLWAVRKLHSEAVNPGTAVAGFGSSL